jgi:hemin uptake protein HemP
MTNQERDSREEDEDVNLAIDPEAASARTEQQRLVRARDLVGGDKILRIEHQWQIYTLRITRNDRLILTK